MLKDKKAARQTETPAEEKNKRRISRKARILLGILAVILALIVLAAVLFFNHMYSKLNSEAKAVPAAQEVMAADMPDESVEELVETSEEIPEEADASSETGAADTLGSDELQTLEEQLYANILANAEPVDYTDDVFSVLLLGNDSRNGKTDERTDVMLLVSINKSTKKIVLTSFLRDLYVHIPGYGSTRLNAANVAGGPALTIATIEQNFGVSIDAYASVSFECFENVIDTFGGVDVELSSSELYWLVPYGASYLGSTPGVYHLDGVHALAYCRNRYSDSDFGRTNRQRTVMSAVWEKAKDASLAQLYDLLQEILPEITTDLSKNECLSLLLQVSQIKSYELSSQQIPVYGGYYDAVISGMMVLVPYLDTNTSVLRDTIYGVEAEE